MCNTSKDACTGADALEPGSEDNDEAELCHAVFAGSNTEGFQVTLEFVKDMLQAFREQKTIHKRCVLLHRWEHFLI